MSSPNEIHHHKSRDRIGVMLCALGTPDAPTPTALRKYLKEFLSDPRVIELPKLLWLPVLYGPILTVRSRRSARAYKAIWDHDKDQSPLRIITNAQAEGLQQLMGKNVVVTWAFRYGTPSIKDALNHMMAAGVDKLLFVPLYPQYSATTVASANDKLFEELARLRWQPALRTVTSYFDDDHYISALAQSVKSDLDSLSFQPEHIIASYHSIPKAYWEKGDPYPCQCFKTSRLLRGALDLGEGTLVTSFQSRVGPSKWVGPYTDDVVRDLARKGVKKIAMVAPAFAADCLETLEEINIDLREVFLGAGGTDFHYIACLNDTAGGLSVLETITRRELTGWI